MYTLKGIRKIQGHFTRGSQGAIIELKTIAYNFYDYIRVLDEYAKCALKLLRREFGSQGTWPKVVHEVQHHLVEHLKTFSERARCAKDKDDANWPTEVRLNYHLTNPYFARNICTEETETVAGGE